VYCPDSYSLVILISGLVVQRGEQQRRDELKANLEALQAVVPGLEAHHGTRKELLAFTRHYILQMQNRERKLRSLWIESKLDQRRIQKAGSDLTNELLEELEGYLAMPEDLQKGRRQSRDGSFDAESDHPDVLIDDMKAATSLAALSMATATRTATASPVSLKKESLAEQRSAVD
jgi:hypothetical protein